MSAGRCLPPVAPDPSTRAGELDNWRGGRRMAMDSQDRYRRGWEKLKEVDGEAGERIIESLKDIAPDFARYLIEFPFGDIYSRPGLHLKSHERAFVAPPTAPG